MPRSSKKHLDQKLKEDIWDVFRREVKKINEYDEPADLLRRFLTENEINLLEKRLATIYFLRKGESLRETSKKADVSKMTVVFVKRGLKKSNVPVQHYPQHYPDRAPQKRRLPGYGSHRWDFLNG